MKRTYPANIDGHIFYIDEDAYLMLQDYLQQLKLTFKGTEGAEIVGDIESRIRELFEERIASGANVIVKADVTSVIETMGRPEQITGEADIDSGEINGETGKTQRSGEEESKPFVEFNFPTRKRLYRNMKNKIFGGVLGGVATYLGWNANILRLLYAVIACFCNFWVPMFVPLIVLYLLGWMIIPPAQTPRQILEMKGEPVNVDTVGQTFMENSPTATANGQDEEPHNFFSLTLSVVGKVVMGFLGIIGCMALIGGLITFLSVGVCQLWCEFSDLPDIFRRLPWEGERIYFACIMIWSLAAAIAGWALAWASSCTLFNTGAASKTTKITVFVMEILLISLGIAVSVVIASM